MPRTRVLKVSPESPEPELIREAAEVLQRGGLVAFPTETVYGLGANALDDQAVRRIFEAKRRPSDNPIIIHIAHFEDLYVLARDIPESAERLTRRFWPGPLTLILPRSELVPDAPTAGLSTVAIRMPSHPVARALIQTADIPVAAPSANLAGRPSPTSAAHVIADLADRIDLVLDGGEIVYGVESTVLDLTSDPPVVLRPGPITVEDLKSDLGEVEVHPLATGRAPDEEVIARSPGMKYRHYAPRAGLVLVEGTPDRIPSKIRELVETQKRRGLKVGVVVTSESLADFGAHVVKVVGSRRDPRTIARNLFRVLRELDAEGIQWAAVEGIEPSGIGLAIMNRLKKAAGHHVVRV